MSDIIITPTIKIVKMAPDARLPVRSHPTDSGLDICFHSLKRVYKNYGGNSEVLVDKDELLDKFMDGNSLSLPFGWRALIGTGLKATVGPGYEIQVRARSGLALKQGLALANGIGTIDYEFRDEICAIIINLSRMDQKINYGDRIAQLVVCPVVLSSVEEVKNLDNNNRGGGFGSTNA